MSRFFTPTNLSPYTPGEQPRDTKYIKLNTNESPFPPSEKALTFASEAAKHLELYSDPECKMLNEKMANHLKIKPSEILFTNGSDEILNFAFAAFCSKTKKAVFPDITYGFYPVFANLYNIPYKEIPLKDDFTIDITDYFNADGTIFIANPNAPTGIILSLSDIEKILLKTPDNVVVIDEAYIDFGGESAISLINKYKNLLVTQTFSKSRSMAGARLGYGVACEELISDLNTIKYSTNPYNINSMTMAAGIGSIEDSEYMLKNCKTIIENRAYATNELEKLGFNVLPSSSNFVFACHPDISGEKLYLELKKKGILVRHFTSERICEFNRITIGTMEQMQVLIEKIKEILEENK